MTTSFQFSGEGIAQIITSLATLIGVVGALLGQIRTNRKLNENHALIDQVKTATDGMTEKLVATASSAAHAQGIKDEHQRVTDRTDIQDAAVRDERSAVAARADIYNSGVQKRRSTDIQDPVPSKPSEPDSSS